MHLSEHYREPDPVNGSESPVTHVRCSEFLRRPRGRDNPPDPCTQATANHPETKYAKVLANTQTIMTGKASSSNRPDLDNLHALRYPDSM